MQAYCSDIALNNICILQNDLYLLSYIKDYAVQVVASVS